MFASSETGAGGGGGRRRAERHVGACLAVYRAVWALQLVIQTAQSAQKSPQGVTVQAPSCTFPGRSTRHACRCQAARSAIQGPQSLILRLESRTKVLEDAITWL